MLVGPQVQQMYDLQAWRALLYTISGKRDMHTLLCTA